MKQNYINGGDAMKGTEMDTYFIDNSHQDRFAALMAADHTSWSDTERISLFYLISGNEDLYARHRHIYDFENHAIRRCIETGEVDFSSGMAALLRLGFNLFNGYKDQYTAPLEVFWNLDMDNRLLAYGALRLRFDDL